MGVIKRRDVDTHVLLNSEHVVGRNIRAVNTFVPGNDISRIHARFLWENNCWHLVDHSLNGTMVNKKHLSKDSVALKKGDLIKFGSGVEAEWIFEDDAAPTSYFQSLLDPNKVLALAERQGVPVAELPGFSFFFSPGHCWRAETAGTVIDLVEGVKLSVENQDWIFVENDVMSTTRNMGNFVQEAHFLFKLSSDEEYIEIILKGKGWEVNLGQRSHNYLLLALARKRAEDAAESAGQGWVYMDELCRDMSLEFRKDIDEYAVNLQIHRIRKQLMKAQPYGYLFSNCIERRKGQVRFAHPYFQIQKESESILEVLPQ